MKLLSVVSWKMFTLHCLAIPLTLLMVLICTRFGSLFSLPPTNISAFWPVNALLFSAVLTMQAKRRSTTLLLALPTYTAAELWIGYPLSNSIIYGLANVTEVAAMLWLLRLSASHSLTFDSLKSLFMLLGLALIASPVGGALGAVGAALGGAPFAAVFFRWSVADFFGYCLCVPLALTWAQFRQLFTYESATRILEFASLLTVLLCIAVFSSGVNILGFTAPFGAQFLPMPILLWAALRFGPPGGAIATIIVACIVFYSTTHGVGLFAIGSPDENVGSLQLFFASLVVSIMTVASLKAESKKSFDALRASEERLYLATRAGNVGIWDWDIVRDEVTWDESMYNLYGIYEEDFSGAYDAWSRTLHPDDSQFAEGAIQAALRGEREYAIEFRIVRPDGTVRNIKADSKTFRGPNGKPIRMIGTNIDITERKQAEEALLTLNTTLEQRIQEESAKNREKDALLIQQSRHLVTAQEEGRRRLSAELHNRTSPNLAAIAVNLDIVASQLTQEYAPNLAERLEDASALIEDTSSSIREICADLRPPLLDYAGLWPAVEGYAQQFSRRTGIAVQLECDNRNAKLAPDMESLLFRIFQEALTNCAKHAHPTSVRVTLNHGRRPIVLTITDNGAGFDPKQLGNAIPPGLGLINMREMAEVSGGRFSIESAPGKGTHIYVEI